MPITAGRLESAVFALLHFYPHGKGAGSLEEWSKWIGKRLGEHPTDAETVETLKRLRDRGFVRLVKYTPQYNSWYDYAKDQRVDERWFFYMDSFWVNITEEGRALWNIHMERLDSV